MHQLVFDCVVICDLQGKNQYDVQCINASVDSERYDHVPSISIDVHSIKAGFLAKWVK